MVVARGGENREKPNTGAAKAADNPNRIITQSRRMFGFGGRGAATAAGASTCSRHANGLAFRASVRGCAVRGAPAHNVADAAGAAKVETTSRVKVSSDELERKVFFRPPKSFSVTERERERKRSLTFVRFFQLHKTQLRFKRMGRKKRPFYRLVAIDSRRKREGLALEELGYYNPLTKETHLNAESIQKWIKDGAEPSDTVASLLKKAMPAFAEK